ncbi:MAG: MATE family efflux transporter [Haloferacaceae archaeon]
MSDRLASAARSVAELLERLGVIDVEQLRPTIDLAWPRVVTGFAIMSKQTADLAMVGLAVGASAAAGLAFAYAYWGVAVFFGLGLAGGTVSLVSQNYGGGETERAALVVKQSILLGVAIALPIVIAYGLFAERLIGPLGGDPDAIGHGARYLTLVAPAVLFELLNHIASRTYAGVGDTFTPMVARAGGALLNVGLSGALIFGAGMGVAGAAIGTTVSIAAVTLVLAWGMLGNEYGRLGMAVSPVPVDVRGQWIAPTLARQLVEISTPLIARRVAEGVVVFPLLWIAASFGPVVVAALEVGRRVRGVINSVRWGFSIASSTLVGQRLGADEEADAGEYGAAIIRLTVVVYVGVALLVVAFSTPIASLFVTDPEAVSQAAAFVVVGAISAVGLGIDGAATGALRGAGDTRWPFVASLVGRYVFALPVAAVGMVTPLGVAGLYLALVLEAFVPGAVNVWLFRTGRWKAISRRYRPSTTPE